MRNAGWGTACSANWALPLARAKPSNHLSHAPWCLAHARGPAVNLPGSPSHCMRPFAAYNAAMPALRCARWREGGRPAGRPRAKSGWEQRPTRAWLGGRSNGHAATSQLPASWTEQGPHLRCPR